MSVTWVIDSSVGFAWVHPNQATPETDKLLQEIEAGATVVVPALWFIEMANSLLVLTRLSIPNLCDTPGSGDCLLRAG